MEINGRNGILVAALLQREEKLKGRRDGKTEGRGRERAEAKNCKGSGAQGTPVGQICNIY